MGEVYRARDTKLNRDVAIKVIPDTFALDPDRLARFKREAQVLASLNHPHIGAIYGFEDSGETHALVLELVEGPTLADMIAEHHTPEAESLRSRPAPAALASADARARRAGVGPREHWRKDSEAAARRGSPEPGAPGVGPRRREIGPGRRSSPGVRRCCSNSQCSCLSVGIGRTTSPPMDGSSSSAVSRRKPAAAARRRT